MLLNRAFKTRINFVLTVFCCFSANNLIAQNFMHGYGATISVLSAPGITLSQTNLCYFPRYNFIENENSSVSVGMPIGAGIGISNNSYGDDAGIAFAFDLPAVIDYNIGCKSTPDNDHNFGGYFGAGFGYYKVFISQSSYSDFTGATYGPMARAGVRFSSSNEGWNGLGITIGMFYKKGLEKLKFNTVGFNILIDM